MKPIRYLQVTHIPFIRRVDGDVVTDELWANDLLAIAGSMGALRVAAPELPEDDQHVTWGPTAVTLPKDGPVTFAGFPPLFSRRDYWKLPAIRRVLRKEVDAADLVHTSNLFPPYLVLAYAHHLAVRRGKKTLFAVVEDFKDMLGWEWVRTASTPHERWVREKELDRIDRCTRECARTATMTFLFTPPAVEQFRLDTSNGVVVRDTTHHADNVIDERMMEEKRRKIIEGETLEIIAACRHKPLKGVDLIVRAAAQLKKRGVPATFKLYGHGPLTTELQNLARDLGVEDCVAFPGALSPDQVYAEMAHAHAAVMAHRTNDFARAFYDAMTGGTPVIAFDTLSSRGTVRPDVDGLLVPLDNVIALAVAVERLHHDRELLAAMSRNAQRRALAETQEVWHAYRAERIRELFRG